MPTPSSLAGTSPVTTTEVAMTAGDARRAIRYLLVVVLVYSLIAVATGRGIRPLELAVFAAGVVALAMVAHRLSD